MIFAKFLEWMKTKPWTTSKHGHVRQRGRCPLEIWMGQDKFGLAAIRKGMSRRLIYCIVDAADFPDSRNGKRMRRAVGL